ncbi:rhodanese-like domain-containing protein [Arthrobacter sp. KK5.5]|uniref:rhodanese-like domain-containing protein n=1 Tax=Arthrobacter sp. KK5.5 TaxID=3373084 RepID=UPI003EE6D2AE
MTTSTIAPAVLAEWRSLHPDVRVLDVRSAAEHESLRIASSINIPLPIIGAHAKELAASLQGNRVVLACQTGARAEQAGKALAAVGLEATVLDGGVPGFAEHGGEVVRGKQVWAMDRQVRLTAGSLVLAGLLGGKFVSPNLRLLAGGVAGALAATALANICPMADVLGRMPWNRSATEPTLDSVRAELS